MIERSLVAKEEGLVGGHGLDHLGNDGRGSGFHLLHEFADAGQPGLARKRKQPAFDQILLVGGQMETGWVPEKLAQVFVIGRGHGRPLKGNWRKFRLTSCERLSRITPAPRTGTNRLPRTSLRRCPCRTA